MKKRIAIDSMIVIYLLQQRTLNERIYKHLEAADEVVFSAFGVGEVLTGFEKTNDLEGKLGFFAFMEAQENLRIPMFGQQEALIFAKLRAKYPSVKSPDAIHLATAISARADAFLTNDKVLLKVKEIKVVQI